MGRPPKYKNAQEIQEKIDIYFDECKGEFLKDDDGMPVLNKQGKPVIFNQKVPTVTGLALALGFSNRRSLLEYQGKKEFVHTITRAKSMIEEYAESRLFDRDGARGAEFSLKCNFRWNDNQAELEAEKLLADEAEKIIVKMRKLAKENDSERD